jgi:DNA-binding LacI/PurR family transcriptional regulator
MVTIYDIAKAAGTSKSSVAYALTGKGKVSKATRKRILLCAREMGYRPNVIVRYLCQHKTLTIALVLPSLANPFYPEIMEAVENIVREYEYQTLFCVTNGDFALGREQMERLMSRWVDGYIIMGSSLDMADITSYFRQGVPIVLCDWQENEPLLAYLRSVLTFIGKGNLQASICSPWGIDVLLSSLTNRNKDCAWKGSSLYCKQPVFPYLLS